MEELIDSKIVLSMRAIYQSKFGLGLMDQGTISDDLSYNKICPIIRHYYHSYCYTNLPMDFLEVRFRSQSLTSSLKLDMVSHN